MSDKQLVLDLIDDLVLDFMVYDRRDDEDLPKEDLEQLFLDEEITVDEVVERFREALEGHVERLERSEDDDDDDDEDEEETDGKDDED